MSQYSLYGQRISETYPRLLQITSGDTVLDGSGDTRSLYVNGNFSADTIFIGSADLNNIFAPIGAIGSGATTFIRNGLNTYTGGTSTSPTVNISAATLSYVSATTISGETLYSGATNLSTTIINVATATGDFTRIQPGLNVYTGGTENAPTINISAATLSYLSASTISGGTFYGDGSGLSGIGNSITVSLAWRFDSNTSETDPGSGDFRFNSTNPSSISKIYVDTTTSNGINASVILSRLKSGSEIYVQQKDNANTAILFSVTSSTIDNSGWFTIPVAYVSDNGGIVPQNNKDCLFLLFNAPSIDSNTYVTGFTYDNANKLTIKQNDGISDLSAVINTVTGLTVNGGLSASTFTASTTGAVAAYISNDAYASPSGLPPLSVNDGNGLLSLGYNSAYLSNTVGGMWFRPTFGLYIEGNSLGYGVFIPTKGGNTGLNVQNKVRIGDGQFNEGDTLEVIGTARISGYTRSQSLSATSLSAETIQSNSLTGSTNSRVVEASSGGTISATKQIISAYGLSTAVKSLLEDRNNWYGGIYTGATITGTYQGQKHYNIDYFFEAVENDLFIRLPRV